MLKVTIPLLHLDFACDVTEAYSEDPRINFGDDTVTLSWDKKKKDLACLEELGQNITILSITE